MIGGVSASDVLDMSSNPDNNNFVCDSIDTVSQDSVSSSYADQLSNEAVSSSSQSTDGKAILKSSESTDAKAVSSSSKTAEDSSHETTFDDLDKKNSTGSSKKTTSLNVSSTKVNAGSPVTVTLKDNKGKVLSGKKILFNVTNKNKVYTRTTDSKGQARFTYAYAGTYKLIISFAGDKSYSSSKMNSTIKIAKSSTNLKVKTNKVPRTTSLIVTLTNKDGVLLANKKISFKIPHWKNKVYTKKTDSNGQARLTINAERKFAAVISYAGTDNFAKSSCKATIYPKKCGTELSYKTLVQYGSNYIVTLKKKVDGHPIKNRKVSIKISNKGKSYTKKTNSKGQVSIPIGDLGKLKMKISFAGDDVFVKSSASPNVTVEKGATKIIAPTNVGKGFKYVVTLKNSAGKVLSNRKVVITINNKTYTKTTNSKGEVSLSLGLKKGSYPLKIKYAGSKNYNSSNVSKTLKVVDPAISISKIITAAKDLKTRVEYVNILNKSYSVTIDNRKYTMDEFAYLMAGAITNLNKGSKADVKIKDLSNNYSSSGAKINGKLSKSDYLKLATNITKYVDSKNTLPSSQGTGLGKMEANLYMYGFAAVLNSYSSNKKLPSSVTVKTNYVRGGYSISISQSGKILNYREIFDSDAFAKYLKTGGKSALSDAMKKKAKELTAGLSSPKAKANAIFEFVRDDVRYSFYTNSKKGAAKTFSSRSGNCCDKANLIVAMCRSVGIYARYSHAKNCKFASGLNTGHVWAQVYDPISQTWYTADATSRRNRLGTINNWNTKSYNTPKNYVLIPF